MPSAAGSNRKGRRRVESAAEKQQRKRIYKDNAFWRHLQLEHDDGLSVLQISRRYNLPWTTVYNRLKILRENPSHDFRTENRGVQRSLFTKEQAALICLEVDGVIRSEDGVARPKKVLAAINRLISTDPCLSGLPPLKKSGLYRFMNRHHYVCTGKGFTFAEDSGCDSSSRPPDRSDRSANDGNVASI